MRTHSFMALCLALGLSGWAQATTITVYSERKAQLIDPIFAEFTRETGIEVRTLVDQAPVLIERLAAEGEGTPADMLMTVDAGSLWQAGERGVLRELDSASLKEAIPASLRDEQGRWFGLSLRARTIVYDKRLVKPEQLSTLAALAGPEWKGKLCLRSSKKIYNQSLVAMMLARDGEASTESVVRGWVANLAAPPFADDMLAIGAVAAGRCEVALVNSYYLGRMLDENPELPVSIFWADQQGTGVHVNISGAGITRHAKQAEAAQRLLEWLASDKAQAKFAEVNFEYPANPRIPASSKVAGWGNFKPDQAPIAQAGQWQAEAVKLMDRAGWK